MFSCALLSDERLSAWPSWKTSTAADSKNNGLITRIPMDKWRGRCTAVLSFLASTYAWPTHCVCVYICMYARRFDQRAAHAARYTRSNGRLDHNGDETGKEIYDFRFKLTTCKRQELDASKTQHRRCTYACMYRKKTWKAETKSNVVSFFETKSKEKQIKIAPARCEQSYGMTCKYVFYSFFREHSGL